MRWYDVRFVLDQHAELDFNSAMSLKQQSEDRHVAPLGHMILIPSQSVFALTPWCCVLSEEATNTNFIVFGLIRSSNPRSTTLDASTLTIIPSMRSLYYWRLHGKEIYISRILKFIPVLEKSRLYHNRNYLFLWLISGGF